MIDQAFVQSFYPFLPNPVALTLYRKTGAGTSGDTFDSTTYSQPTCRQRPVDQDTVVVLGGDLSHTWCMWTVWNRSQAYLPKPGDVLQESGGTRWTVRTARKKGFGAFYSCVCEKELV